MVNECVTGRGWQRIPFFSILLAALLCAAAYLCFELGRYQAGYSLVDARRQQAQDRRALAELERTVEDLRRQVAILETSREIDRETYAQVEANLSTLQARIQAQDEELAFYQSIVSPHDGVPGLRIQNLEIVAADAAQRYLLKMVLVQAIVHRDSVAGAVRLQLVGRLDGEPHELDLEDLAADGDVRELSYAFRYFQGIELPLVLPAGFRPDRVDVQILPSEPRGQPVTHSFQWAAVSA